MEPSDIIYKIEQDNDKPEKKPKKKQMKDIFEIKKNKIKKNKNL